MKKIFVTLVAASALASVVSYAGEVVYNDASTVQDNSSGLYLNANVGYGYYDLKDDAVADVPGVSLNRQSIAWSANIGYQFNPYVAVEAGYMALPQLTVTVDDLNGQKVKLNTDAITFDVKGIYPVSQQFDVFAKAGFAYENQSIEAKAGGKKLLIHSDDHHIAPLFGLGVDYNINQNWAIGVQGVVTLKSGDDDYPATYTGLVGVTYKFS